MWQPLAGPTNGPVECAASNTSRPSALAGSCRPTVKLIDAPHKVPVWSNPHLLGAQSREPGKRGPCFPRSRHVASRLANGPLGPFPKMQTGRRSLGPLAREVLGGPGKWTFANCEWPNGRKNRLLSGAGCSGNFWNDQNNELIPEGTTSAYLVPDAWLDKRG